jgi:ATP-dependent exoDNAse (exonuclease V) beta subunit
MKTATNPKGITITFDPAAHRYETDLCKDFISVTTLVKTFANPFDTEKNAARVAARDGRTVEEVVRDWKDKAAASCRLGTRVHETAEAAILGQSAPHSPETDQERDLMATAWQACTDLLDAGWVPVQPELIVFSENYGVGGTIDLPIRDGDGMLWILDWKTNAKIDREGFAGAMCRHPMSHLPDCAFTSYSLQLATYERLLRDEEYIDQAEPVRRALVHVRRDGYEVIETPALSHEVAELLLAKLAHSIGCPF